MINVYEFIISGLDYDGNILNNVWISRSQHTQLVDAEAQLQRCLDSGDLIENLKIVSDDSDPNAPEPIPEPIPEEPLP